MFKFHGINVVLVIGFKVQKASVYLECHIVNPLYVLIMHKLLGWALDWCCHFC